MTTDPPEPAKLWRRAVSRTVDLIFLAVCIAGGFYVAHKASADYYPLNDLLVWFVILLCEVLLPLMTGGATLGRVVAGLSLVSEDGSRPSAWQHIARAGTRIALFAVFVVFVSYEIELPAVLFVGVVEGCFCAVQKRRQTLGDLVGRTVVTRRFVKLATG